MSYKTYITEAIVCGSYDDRSADRSYYLFTREGGMIYAHAKSVREERSKHRYGLQVASHVRVTLVRGKAAWRITGIEPIANMYTRAETREARAFLRNTILFLRRVIQGETPHTDIFDDVVAACTTCSRENSVHTETLLFLRTLYRLGYVARDAKISGVLDSDFKHESFLSDGDMSYIQRQIQDALSASHL